MTKSWDEHFAQMAKFIASKSEDESTKCGSVIVGKENEVISTGYNGFPRGIDNKPERQERPIKYKYFEHAERNAIYNCARTGANTLGTKMYVTGIPCADCARAIIQAGVIEVIAEIRDGENDADFIARWKEHTDFTEALFKEANIKLRRYKPQSITI